MTEMLTLWVLSTVLLFTGAHANVLTVSKCHKDTSYLLFGCPANSVIRIHNVSVGLSQNGTCSQEKDDCLFTFYHGFGCSGNRNCSIWMQANMYHKRVFRDCGNRTGNYMVAVYQCVELSEIKDICEEYGVHTALNDTHGYIGSPFFGNNTYPGNRSCVYRISGQDIKVELLKKDFKDKDDHVVINDSHRSHAYGGGNGVMLENVIIAPILSGEVSITFSSNDEGNALGFWIYYEMSAISLTTVLRPTVPPSTTKGIPDRSEQTNSPTDGLERVTPATVQISVTPIPPVIIRPTVPRSIEDIITGGDEHATPTVISWTSPVEPSYDANSNLSLKSSDIISPYALSTILGVVFGFFGALIIVLFTIYFMKRYRDHRKKRSSHRSGGGGNDNVMWHNITNECLTEIIRKHDVATEQAYNNNMMPKEDNSMQGYSKQLIEHSYC